MLFKIFFIYIGIFAFIFCSCNQTSEVALTNSNGVVPTLSEINEKIKQNPNVASLYFERAQVLYNTDLKACLSDLERALSLDSLNTDFLYYRADIYFKNRETRLAREDLNKIIRINPIETTAFLKLAEIYLLLEQYDVAIKNCNEVLKINVFNPQAYFIKGMSYKYAGDTVNAISSFQTTVEQDDKHYDAYIQLGNLFSTQKNPIALEYYNNAILIQPENIEGILFKSIFLQDNKNHIKALEGYDLILKLSPNHKQALFNKGYIYLVFTEEYELAKNIYNTYLKYYPNDPDAIYNLGLAYEELKQISKAIECYKEVLSIVPNHDLAARSLSRLD